MVLPENILNCKLKPAPSSDISRKDKGIFRMVKINVVAFIVIF